MPRQKKPTKIFKKAWPEYFQAVLDGKKNFDLRLADWSCSEGDILVLEEWDLLTKKYTGRTLERKVTYVKVFKIDELFFPEEDIKKYGLQVISLEE